MSTRTVKDSAGRTWTCRVPEEVEGTAAMQGQDVLLRCESDSVSKPVEIRVGWQWEKMADGGLSRLITQASPVPKR